MFDGQTTLMVTTLLLLVLPLLVWLILPGQSAPDVCLWCLASVSAGCGIILLGFQTKVTVIESLHLANAMIMGCFVCCIQSLRMTSGRAWTLWGWRVRMLLTLIVCNVLYGWFNDIWSEVFYLLILGFLSFCTSRWAWYLSKHLRSFNALTIAVAYFLVGLSLVSYSMTIPDHLMDLSLFGTSSEVTVIFLVVLMMSVITHLSYVGLVLDQLALVQLRAIKAEQSAKQADMLGNQISHMDRRGRIAVMSSSLAHELNQPLTAATTYAQLAERVYRLQHTASRVLPVIDQVELAIDRTVRILQRIRGGDIAAQHFKKVDLQKVLDQALDLMSPDFDRWPVTLTHDRSLLPVWCMGDELELSQVVVNLLRNSLQAMERQSMRSLWVSCSVEQGQAKLVIRDQGPGIPTDMMGKWGEPFQTMREGGMGLGLAISLEIMTRHHGKLQLTNLPQGGVEAVMLLLHLNEVAK